MTTVWRTALAAALATVLVAGSARGQEAGLGLIGTHCKAEIAAFCADVAHRRGAVPECLEGHYTELSQKCQWAITNKGPGWGMGGTNGMGGMSGMDGMTGTAQ